MGDVPGDMGYKNTAVQGISHTAVFHAIRFLILKSQFVFVFLKVKKLCALKG